MPDALPRLHAQLLTQASVRHTPCGTGHMVWHHWPALGPNGAPLLAPAQPPVVLLHGGSGSWTHWLHNISALQAAGRPVWAADLPGFGDSAPPASGGDADALVEPLAQAWRALGLLATVPGQGGAGGCDLVGFSFGGLTAGLLLGAHPSLARRLVLVGAPGLGLAVPRLSLRGWRHLPTPEAQNAAHRHNLTELMLRDPSLITAPLLALHAANVSRDRMPRRRLSDTDILARTLPTLRCPVHAIYGANDVLYADIHAPLAQALAAAPHFRGLTLIADAGHWVQFERPQAFDAALLAALGVAPTSQPVAALR
jgi:pimeloyl-ACP methyl ester carboxylesterase